jgi:hypothetical protein
MNFARFLKDTITIASVASRDAFGKPLYGAQRTALGRVEAQRRIVRGAHGEETVSSHKIYLASSVLLTDRLWLPGADINVTEAARTPIDVSSSSDLAGITLVQVLL